MTTNEYKQGWYDGYQAAKNEIKFYPTKPEPAIVPTISYTKSCGTCGMSFTNPDGSLKSMGYVCSKNNCPSKISCSLGTVSVHEHPGVPASSGYSYIGGGGSSI